ncbi:DNA internalization-related competence protein ComEC/Rec2 [Salinicoccus albus]|uniref:DNA internalization-related competence protein ComEC/Rec2 n=1 Tax=Salinicoccus albus TaxID=418756 RepID=UPI000370A2D2|nr:DNA internalization-related competence protein ComEC/Rec2 [Salinicoccus albus]
MIIFLIFLSIVNGYITLVSPALGLFGLTVTAFIAYRKIHLLRFNLLLIFITAVTMTAVFILPESLEEKRVNSVTVTGYKYYQDHTAHIVVHDGMTFDMFLDEETKIPIGKTCSGLFDVTVPSEQRNFIKKDNRLNLKINGLDGRIYHESVKLKHCSSTPLTLNMKVSQLRDKYITRVHSKSQYDYTYDILTLSIGNKSYIESDFFGALQKLDIYHLYVISGTHVAFISGILFFMLKRLGLTINVIKLIMIIVLLLFLAINFFSPSVLRAVLMAVLLIMTSFARKKPYLAVISLTAIVQVIINPFIMYHAGFQLSYITTYLIILTRNFWVNCPSPVQLFGITAIAEVSTLMIVLIQFNEISISGIFMNMIFVPLFSFIIFPMVILYNIMIFAGFPALFDQLYDLVFTGFKALIHFLSGLGRHRFSVQNINTLWMIFLIILSYMMMKEICMKNAGKVLLYSLIFALSLTIINRLSWYDYTMTMVDVGQGDAFIIEDHRNSNTVMVDTGGRYYSQASALRLSDQTVLPYLKESGTDQIDLLILSHMDMDHSGEADHIIQNKDVKNVMVNPFDPGFQEWYQTSVTEDYQGGFINGTKTRTMTVGDIDFEILFPHGNLNSDDSNQHSLVKRVTLGKFEFLFTGDTDTEMESALIDLYGNLSVDVLKLAHHGSNTSTGDKFLKHTDFNYALVSAGTGNRYNHPHPEVIKKLDGKTVYDTSKEGMVKFKIRGDVMCVESKLTPERNHCIKKELPQQPFDD